MLDKLFHPSRSRRRPVNHWFAFICVFAAVTLFTQACSKKQLAPQEACNFVMNSEEQRVSWNSRVPVMFYLHDSVPKTFLAEIQAAADEWNKKLGRDLLRFGGWVNGAVEPRKDGLNVIYMLSTWEADKTMEQARTTIYWTGDTITEFDMRLNGKDFKFSLANSPDPGSIDLRSLVVHELGHALGLAHNETTGSVMRKSLAYGALRREVLAADLSSLTCEY